MPAFLEAKLKKEYGANSSIPYKIMNKMGVMHGNKETAAGQKMDLAHKAASLVSKARSKRKKGGKK